MRTLSFDFIILKDAFGIDLETEIMTVVEGVTEYG